MNKTLSPGQRLKELRTDAKLSHRKLADFCGVSKSELSRLELGQRKGNEDNWRKIEAYFGVPLGVVYEEAQAPIEEIKAPVAEAIFDEPLTAAVERQTRIEAIEVKPVVVEKPVVQPVVKEPMNGPKLVAACYEVIQKLTADNYIRKDDSRNFIPIRSRWPKYMHDLIALVKDTVATCEDLPEILGFMGRAGFSILCFKEQRKAVGLHLKHHDYLPCGAYSKDEPYYLQD